MELSEYLMQRGVKLEPVKIEKGEDLILADKELVQAAGEMWDSKQNLITLIIQNRVNAIGKNILEKCTPYELTVLRDAMTEVAAILDDFAKYHAEMERMKEGRDTQPLEGEVVEEQPAESEQDQPSL